MLLRDAKQRCGCVLELFLFVEIVQKQAIWCLKRKSHTSFIELL